MRDLVARWNVSFSNVLRVENIEAHVVAKDDIWNDVIMINFDMQFPPYEVLVAASFCFGVVSHLRKAPF